MPRDLLYDPKLASDMISLLTIVDTLIRMGWSGERARFSALMKSIEREVRNADKAASAAHISASHHELVALVTPQPLSPQNIDCKVLRYPRSSIFQVRPDILDRIYVQLKPDLSAKRLQAFTIYGMGGVD